MARFGNFVLAHEKTKGNEERIVNFLVGYAERNLIKDFCIVKKQVDNRDGYCYVSPPEAASELEGEVVWPRSSLGTEQAR